MAAKKKSKKSVRPVPKGYSTVTAAMNQTDAAAAIAFCKKAFGAKVNIRMQGGGKIMHAEMQIGDSIVMISDSMREPARVSGMFLYVPNVDKVIAKAVKAGATVTLPAADAPWGDRYGRIVDPLGNHWAIATHIEDVSPAESKKRLKAFAKQNAMS
jgi:uncharacterized glyoxalase superfamily protein PhnB